MTNPDLAKCGGCGVLTDATEPHCDRCGYPEGWAMVERGWTPPAPLRCEWFLLCENDATTTRPHPVLGAVPICARCNAKIEAL